MIMLVAEEDRSIMYIPAKRDIFIKHKKVEVFM